MTTIQLLGPNNCSEIQYDALIALTLDNEQF